MRDTSVDQSLKLIPGLDLSVQDVISHIHNLKELHFFLILMVSFHFKLNVPIFFSRSNVRLISF